MKQTPYYFLLPSILILAFTSLYPICYSVYYSLFNWRWGDEKDFIGLNNYIVLLTDEEFWIIVKNTFVFAFFACFFEILIGVLLAIYIDRIKIGSTIIRTVLLIPLMVSGISVTMLFKVMLDNMFGIIPYLLSFIGLKSDFFGSYTAAMPTIIALDVWWQTSFVFIIILAGLKSIPNEPIEAAKIDGAKPMRFFIDVLIPISRVNIAALFVIMFIFGWNQYLWPILMTTDPSMSTIIMGVDMMIGGSDDVTTWPVVMAASILSMLPPIIVVLSMQKLFIRGLTDSDK